MAHDVSGQNPFNQQAPIPGVKHIIAVSSGKGGVGKSTVAVNLAVSLGKKAKVGLLDADIYGPSLPRMMGLLGQKPPVSANQKIEPLSRYGIQCMSIGLIVEESSAVVWRGPMLFKALSQFLFDVQWGELDYLVIDLPPGTGDVQLTLAQKVPVNAAVIVSTPQNMSLIDVKKAVDMWNRVNVPILGMIENMSYMINPANGEKIQMFPKGELDAWLDQKRIPKLAEMPFHTQLGIGSETGIPMTISHPDSLESRQFSIVADSILDRFKK